MTTSAVQLQSALLRRLSHPGFVAAIVALGFLAQARVAINDSHHFDYVKMDFAHALRGHGSSAAIDRAVAEGPVHRDGYDGQFSYFIALDPVGAALHLDDPAYRYGRIGYPLVARAVALGRPEWIRGSLIIVNALAIAAATFFLGLLLTRRGASAWWSLVFATYPGFMLIAFTRDTTEPLAYALALAGLWLIRKPTAHAAAKAGLVFAAAALTRETTLLFALATAALLFRRHSRAAVVLATISIFPYLAWKVFLAVHFRESGSGHIFTSPIPLSGILERRPWTADEWVVVLAVMIPVFIWLVLTARACRRWQPLPLITLANCLLLLFAGPSVFDGYGSAGRVAAGAAGSAVAAFPAIREQWGQRVAVAGLLLWSLPWWIAMNSLTAAIV